MQAPYHTYLYFNKLCTCTMKVTFAYFNMSYWRDWMGYINCTWGVHEPSPALNYGLKRFYLVFPFHFRV